MYVDSSDLNSPVAMETDVPLIEDVQRLKKTVEEGATQVNLTFSLPLFTFLLIITLSIYIIYINKLVCFQSLQSLLIKATCATVIIIAPHG